MDLMAIDVTDIDNISYGDDVVLIGKQGDDEIRIEEFAAWAGTISYEILTNISARVPRVYVGETT